ncbi:MAG: DNA polymerase III subunit delta, partial [Deltaproteobacteria bacterium]|jgi:DNA polymerase-3 subunit delta|nr:DNA polymerase III subunit delta [Deltaproteobacteria bacterium]MBW2534403.1 DNA polymerase III subunit delta [Deltaproteobacteria bacterium]
VTGSSAVGFNDDRFVAGEAEAEVVVAAARTLPMMASHRVVTLVGVERWEQRGGAGKSVRGPLDVLADYADDPSPSTVLLVVGSKIHGGRRLMKQAKKEGYLVSCPPLTRRDLPDWIRRAATERGHRIKPHVAEALAEMVGPELGPVDDALERLSLYVGDGADITEEALAQVVTRVRQDTVWQLVDALGQRRLGRALASLADAYDPRDGGLRLLGAVAWSVRQLIKYASARRAGQGPPEAAKSAGVPPFKVKQVERTVREVTPARLEGWLERLADADRALKSSSRPGRAILEALLIDLCR